LKNCNCNPEVSVIIPTYNRSEKIIEAIESVLSQSFKDFEIIVIDDGSEDCTQKVLEKYKEQIIICTKSNSGVSAARNCGLIEAKGNWVAFLDSDDKWFNNKLEKQIEFNKANGIDVSFCNYALNSSVYEILENRITNSFELFLLSEEKLHISTLLVKRKLLRFFDETLSVCEDNKLYYDLASKVKTWGYLGEPLASITRDVAAHSLMNTKEPAKIYKMASDSLAVHYQALLISRKENRIVLNRIKKIISNYSFVVAKMSVSVYGYKNSLDLILRSIGNARTMKIFIKTIFLLIVPPGILKKIVCKR